MFQSVLSFPSSHIDDSDALLFFKAVTLGSFGIRHYANQWAYAFASIASGTVASQRDGSLPTLEASPNVGEAVREIHDAYPKQTRRMGGYERSNVPSPS
jgi:hypothetical protein